MALVSNLAFWGFDAHVYAAATSKPFALELYRNLHGEPISERRSIVAVRSSRTSDLWCSLRSICVRSCGCVSNHRHRQLRHADLPNRAVLCRRLHPALG